MKLRDERGLDAIARLVAGPEVVSERLDDMVGRHSDVRGARLEHLEHGLQHAGHGAEWPVLALRESPQAVEVAEQLVRPVDKMNDHCVGSARSSGGTKFERKMRSSGVRDARPCAWILSRMRFNCSRLTS